MAERREPLEATLPEGGLAEIELPWSAWHADTVHRLKPVGSWRIDRIGPGSSRPLEPSELRGRIDEPAGSRGLPEVVRGRKSACIVIDDAARPTRTAELLPIVLARLAEGGIDAADVRIVAAVGSHRALTDDELNWKVGADIRARCAVESHDCRGELAPTGIQYGDAELRINRTYMQSEVRVVIGSVLPHPFAGFSGGAKLVLPGLADLNSIQRSHQFVQMGLRGGADPNANGFRKEAERIVRELGLDYALCVVPNIHRETVGLCAGDFVKAHRQACRCGEAEFSAELTRTYDCAIVNAFPKDVDLIQAESAFTAWKSVKAPVVKEGGIVVLTCAAPGGRGRHGLFEPGGVSYRRPQPKRWLRGRELWLYTPSVPADDVHELYWEGYPVFRDGEELMAELGRRLPEDARVGVFPCGPLQIVRDGRG